MATRGDASSDRPPPSPWTHLGDRLSYVRARIRARFAIDTRSLAAVRIALGLILLGDLIHRATQIGLFYTDEGVYPRSAYMSSYTSYSGLSLHAVSGELWVQGVLFVVAALFAVAFILGYRTRLVGLVSLVLLFSLHARNPAVLNGGDRLLRVVLLVALVTPLGERWSIDALRRGWARTSVVSLGTAALLIQPLVVFTSNAIEKHRGETWFAGDALEVAMANDVMTVHLGNVLAAYPTLLTVLNYGWVVLLSGSVVFLLVPVGRFRALSALAYMGAFAGMLATLSVGWFPLVLAASVIPFLTAPFWDALRRRIPPAWVQRIPRDLEVGPLRQPPVERRLLEGLRERGHGVVASYSVATARVSMRTLGGVVLFWILLFSATGVTGADVPDVIDHAQLDQQRWGLYAPDPSTSYSWYVVGASLANGETVDALEGGPLGFEAPPDAADAYDTFRDRKFMESVRDSGKGEPGIVATSYATWACRQAQQVQDVTVEEVTVYRMRQASPIDGELEDPRKIVVVIQPCSGPDA